MLRIVKSRLTCPYCSIVLNYTNISIDHTLAKSRGGSDSVENIHFICLKCNFLKGSLTEKEFLILRHKMDCDKELKNLLLQNIKLKGAIKT